MTRSAHGRRSGRWAPLLFAGGVACNALIGIEDPIVVAPAGQPCILNSDCNDDMLVCLFETCSPRCARDVDCERGEFCLKTDDGSGCVSTSEAACGLSEPCPPGTACFDGQCRADCRENSAICLSDQRCDTDGACRGPDGSGGSGGSGGGGGSGGSKGGKGGAAGTAGSGVVAGEGGSGASDVSGGSAGAAGDQGEGGAGGEPVVPGDPCTDEGALKCAGAASNLRLVCAAGEWQTGEPCGQGELCDRAADVPGTCASIVAGCVGLQPGGAYCEGAERVVCGPDLVTTTSDTCASQDHCRQATTAVCAACVTGEHSCNGDVLGVCNGAHTGFDQLMTCTEEPCNALLGRCTTLVCEPGEYSCEAGTNTLRRCNDDGTDFASEIDCGSGICDAAGGECDDCAPNEVLSCVDGTRKSVCNEDGQGTRAVVCAEEDPNRPVCIGAGLCRACTPSETECVDKFRLRSCTTGGSWDSPVTCTGQACAGDRCTGVCVPDSRDCVDELSIRVCNDQGQYGEPTACDGQACVNDGCAGECEPDTFECEDELSRKRCTEQGTWGMPVRCDDQACVNGACVGECAPHTLNCVDQFAIERCGSDGQYGAPTTCTGQACYMDQCTGICVPGTRSCLSNTQYRVCGADGQYPVNGTPCMDQACSAGQCVGNCSPGTQRCAPAPANASQICNTQGAWDTETTCSASLDTLCRVNGGDAACTPNPSYVVGKNVPLSSSTSVAANHLLGNPVRFVEKVRVLKFGIIVRAAAPNCHVRMALYTHNSGPAARAGFSVQTPGANLVAQTYLLDPSQQLTVPAGDYWLMAHYECATSAYANDTPSGEPDLRAATNVPYSGGPPDPFPSASSLITSFAVNHFVEVQAVP